MDEKIAILGAGISGLGAGYQLMKAGFEPVIFEKESFIGGRMSSDRVDGFTIDKGANTFPEFHKNGDYAERFFAFEKKKWAKYEAKRKLQKRFIDGTVYQPNKVLTSVSLSSKKFVLK